MTLEKIISDLIFVLIGIASILLSIKLKKSHDKMFRDIESRKILKSEELSIRIFGIIFILVGIVLLLLKL